MLHLNPGCRHFRAVQVERFKFFRLEAMTREGETSSKEVIQVLGVRSNDILIRVR